MKKKPPFHDIKNFFKEYNTFTTGERKGLLLLAVIIIALLSLLTALKFYEPKLVADTQRLREATAIWDSLHSIQDSVRSQTTADGVTNLEPKTALFYFDPNIIPDSVWQQLGLSPKQVASVRTYMNKGGRFRIRSDVKKLYVVNDSLYQLWYPYILLPDSLPKEMVAHQKNDSVKYGQSHQKIIPIEINIADADDWQKLPLIGVGRADAIITYRNKLGGFISTDQLREIAIIPDSVFLLIQPFLLCNFTRIEKRNINTSNTYELKHPYLDAEVARVIVNYRKVHGNYSSVEQLKTLKILNQKEYEKLAPYLTVQ
jgi:DNA uptake protein ComE-like DNA-binding protein